VFKSSRLKPLSQLRIGRKDFLLQSLNILKYKGDWDSIYLFCKECFSETEESGQPLLLVSDWAIWKSLIDASAAIGSKDTR
jgi:hypothetical protein